MTDFTASNAIITKINPSRIQKHLLEGKVVIVTGFQGITEFDKEGEITTLGRGGSDTTAVALAVALKCNTCEIYTDVDGIYTVDPHLVPNARKLSTISYEEMLELALAGAKMRPMSIELGSFYNINIDFFAVNYLRLHLSHLQLIILFVLFFDKSQIEDVLVHFYIQKG